MSKRCPFAPQKGTFCNAKGRLLPASL